MYEVPTQIIYLTKMLTTRVYTFVIIQIISQSDPTSKDIQTKFHPVIHAILQVIKKKITMKQ